MSHQQPTQRTSFLNKLVLTALLGIIVMAGFLLSASHIQISEKDSRIDSLYLVVTSQNSKIHQLEQKIKSIKLTWEPEIVVSDSSQDSFVSKR